MSYIPNPLIIPVGVFIGIAVSAPVGPVNVLCVQRALHRGIMGGVAAGLGAVLGDGLIAFGGGDGHRRDRYDGDILPNRRFRRSAGLVLLSFGAVLCDGTRTVGYGRWPASATGQLLTTSAMCRKSFLMTVTNPGAVLGLFAIFGGIGTFVEVRSSVDAIVLVGAIMAGSLLWWTMLSAIVGSLSGRLRRPQPHAPQRDRGNCPDRVRTGADQRGGLAARRP